MLAIVDPPGVLPGTGVFAPMFKPLTIKPTEMPAKFGMALTGITVVPAPMAAAVVTLTVATGGLRRWV